MNWVVLIGLVLTFATALVGFLQSKRNTSRIAEVHVLVNAQLHTVLDRVDQLTGTLKSAGVPVPPRPGEAGERLAPPGGEVPGVGPGG